MKKVIAKLTVHASAACLFGCGILIFGPAKSGKSSLCLELLDRGHQLISDDAVSLHEDSDRLIATAPPEIHNKLYLREVGIINIGDQFGPQSLIAQCQTHLIIRLSGHLDLPVNPLEKKASKTLLATTLPAYNFAGKDCRLALLVETLCRQVTLESVTDKKDNPC